MILFHASSVIVERPDVLHSRQRVDFGPGFYTTPLLKQAYGWCQKFLREGKDAYICRYALEDAAFRQCKVLAFDAYSEEWLDFVVQCRAGMCRTDADIVTGGVANDKVFDTVELFLDNLIDRKEALRRLRFEKPNAQVCIRTQAVIDRFLHFNGLLSM